MKVQSSHKASCERPSRHPEEEEEEEEGRKDQRTRQQLNINAHNVITGNLAAPKHMFAGVRGRGRSRVPAMKTSGALSRQPRWRL